MIPWREIQIVVVARLLHGRKGADETGQVGVIVMAKYPKYPHEHHVSQSDLLLLSWAAVHEARVRQWKSLVGQVQL